MEKEIDVMVFILRFLFGVVFAVILALAIGYWLEIPLIISVIFVLIIGVLSVIWGDKFLHWFLKIFKYF